MDIINTIADLFADDAFAAQTHLGNRQDTCAEANIGQLGARNGAGVSEPARDLPTKNETEPADNQGLAAAIARVHSARELDDW